MASSRPAPRAVETGFGLGIRADVAPHRHRLPCLPNAPGAPGEVAERAAPAMSAEVGDGSRPLTDANDPTTQPSADAHEAPAPDELQASLGA